MSNQIDFKVGDVFFCPKTKTKYTIAEIIQNPKFPYYATFVTQEDTGSQLLSFNQLLAMVNITRFVDPNTVFVDTRQSKYTNCRVAVDMEKPFDLSNPDNPVFHMIHLLEHDHLEVEYTIPEAQEFLVRVSDFSLDYYLSYFHRNFEELKDLCEIIVANYYRVAMASRVTTLEDYAKMNIILHNSKVIDETKAKIIQKLM